MKCAALFAALLTLAACSKSPQPAETTKDNGSPSGELPYRPPLPDKIPSNVPAYPGSKLEGVFSAPLNGANGQPGASQYEFSTADAPTKVMDYYHRKLESEGMKITLHTTTSDGGMFVAEDDAQARTVNVIVEKGAEGTAIRVTLRPKNVPGRP